MSTVVPQTGLKENEKVLWYGKRSLLSYLGRIIASLIFIILTVIPFIGLVFLIVGMVLLLSALFGARSNTYYITNMRAVQEHRLGGRSIRETSLDKITDIVFSQGLFGRLLNLGTVHFHTAGTGFLGLDFAGIKDPMLVRGTAINAKDEYLKKSGK